MQGEPELCEGCEGTGNRPLITALQNTFHASAVLLNTVLLDLKIDLRLHKAAKLMKTNLLEIAGGARCFACDGTGRLETAREDTTQVSGPIHLPSA